MQSWIGLIGVVAGAGIALLGQHWLRKADRQHELTTLFLEQCAQLIALSEDYRHRLWEERELSLEGVLAEWRLGEYRLVEARLKIICRDPELTQTLEHLRKAGQSLGVTWRSGERDHDEIEAGWRQHREALKSFIEASHAIIERGGIKRKRWVARRSG